MAQRSLILIGIFVNVVRHSKTWTTRSSHAVFYRDFKVVMKGYTGKPDESIHVDDVNVTIYSPLQFQVTKLLNSIFLHISLTCLISESSEGERHQRATLHVPTSFQGLERRNAIWIKRW